MWITAVLCVVALVGQGHGVPFRQQRTFPADFLFGTATASQQVEGAWDEDGKSENIWDHMTHNNPSVILDQNNADVAADSYHNYERDVEMMRELGLGAYRFSLSWARILPDGLANRVNQAGIDYYNNLINEMLRYNIEPMITLYHWDLPQSLQDLGGYANPMIVEWFEDYARVVFENFADRVRLFITFNEPREVCYLGYGSDAMAPMLNSTAIGTYVCAKHLVLCHARAYHLYNNEFKPLYNGQCGITISVNAFEPLTESEEDIFATTLRRQAEWGVYAHPIFSSEGGFPSELVQRIGERSAAQGYPRSRIPEFTDEERDLVRGSADFFGVNHYTANYVSNNPDQPTDPASMYNDIGSQTHIPDDWLTSASYWLYLAPNSIYQALTLLDSMYPNTEFYITENGWSISPDRDLYDDDRIEYYRSAWESVLNTLDAGVNLRGYMAWSLLDNFEWMQGYTERFGLYHVDFESPERTRTPRKSAFVYKQLLRDRYIDYTYDPDPYTTAMTIDEGH